MLDKILLVVSDKFHNFATHKDVITKTELYRLLHADDTIFSTAQKIHLIPGQGFSDEDIANILILAKISKNAHLFDFSLWVNLPRRAPKRHTHKHKRENILISDPKQISKDQFNMQILIDENCEMMNDHQTGLHVQGMVLLEASRQGYLAIFEKFYFDDSNEDKYFIFNHMDVHYNRFAFPLPATLSVSIREIDISNPKKQYAVMDMDVMQCGSKSASFSLEMTIMGNKRISSMESRLANQSLEQHMAHLIHNTHIQEATHA